MRTAALLLLLASVGYGSRDRRSPFDWNLLPGSSLLKLGDFTRETEDAGPDRADRSDIPAGRETEGDEEDEAVVPPRPSTEQKRPVVPFSFVFDMFQPWWDGPNVCTERNEVVEEDGSEADSTFGFGFNFETMQCSPTRTSYICTKKTQRNGLRKTMVVKRSCCHGYTRRKDGKPGCEPYDMINVMDTLRKLEAKKFLSFVESSNLETVLTEQNITVFAPTDDAIVNYEDETEDNQISAIVPAKRLTNVSPVVKRHLTAGFIDVEHLDEEQLLETLDGETQIRINKYYTTHEVVTANCVPLSSKNYYASNGVVHMLPAVLPRPELTIAEHLNSDQFSVFKNLLSESGVLEELFSSEKEGQLWTIFAPTNQAFEKLEESIREPILKGEGCLRELVMNHIVRSIVCAAVVGKPGERVSVHNSLGSVLRLERVQATYKMTVDGAGVATENILATDGMLHALDQVLIPEHAMPLLKSLENMGREDISDLIRDSGLAEELEGQSNLTFFLPPKYSFSALYVNNTLSEDSLEEGRRVILSHVVPTTLSARHLVTKEQKVNTLQGHRLHTKPRDALFAGLTVGAANVQCAHVHGPQRHACGVIVQQVDKVLESPSGSLLEMVKGMKDHKILATLLKNSELEKVLEEEGEASYTLLAPNDVAFRRLSEKSLDELMTNQTAAVEVLKMHIVPEAVCCNEVQFYPLRHATYRTLGGNHLRAHRDLYGVVHFGRAVALRCDAPATNGILHSVSRLLVPERYRSQLHQLFFPADLFPF